MAWQTAGPLCFLIDCWQFKDSSIARVAKFTTQTFNRYIV